MITDRCECTSQALSADTATGTVQKEVASLTGVVRETSFVRLFARSFIICSFSHLFIYSRAYNAGAMGQSFVSSHACTFVRSFDSFVHSLVVRRLPTSIYSFICSFLRLVICWFVWRSFVRSLIHTFIHTFILRLLPSFVRTFVHLFLHPHSRIHSSACHTGVVVSGDWVVKEKRC